MNRRVSAAVSLASAVCSLARLLCLAGEALFWGLALCLWAGAVLAVFWELVRALFL
ncbi:MAG: hypothetical protein PHF19_08930 [Synergistales bacterium]|nr:hypothetical protein [Synergistales bacterium]